jgi:hypothetical protein
MNDLNRVLKGRKVSSFSRSDSMTINPSWFLSDPDTLFINKWLVLYELYVRHPSKFFYLELFYPFYHELYLVIFFCLSHNRHFSIFSNRVSTVLLSTIVSSYTIFKFIHYDLKKIGQLSKNFYLIVPKRRGNPSYFDIEHNRHFSIFLKPRNYSSASTIVSSYTIFKFIHCDLKKIDSTI